MDRPSAAAFVILPSMTRRTILYLLLAVAGASLGLYAAGVQGRDTRTDVPTMVREVVRCLNKRGAIECMRPTMQRAVNAESSAALLDAIAAQVTPLNCHYAGHVLGQELYRGRKNVERVLGECSRICQGACIHGALGEAFTDAIGDDAYIDPKHLSLDDIRKKGKELCTAGNTCHGVGHALFQLLEDFDTSLGVCKDIAPNNLTAYCYRGVFMEYADARVARSVLSDTTYVSMSRTQLDSLCVRDSIDETRSCFIYLPKMVEASLAEEGQKGAMKHVRELCMNLSGEVRNACIAGIGGYRSFQMFSDPDSVRRLCESFASIEDRATCAAGVSAVAAEHDERTKETFAFCRAFEDSDIAESCYRGIFDTYKNKIIGVATDALNPCGADLRCERSKQDSR